MTDKDPKDMTASELLRKAADGYEGGPGTVTEGLIDLMGFCFHNTHSECFEALADKIDAELAEARELSLRQGAELWAKANGWPDFREGEDFGHWLRRCALKRPVFDDGEPMQIGNLVSSKLFGSVSVGAIEYTATDVFVKDAPDGDWSTSILVDKPLKRPAHEVLGADGKPITVGETVYYTSGDDYEPHEVIEISPHSLHLVSISVGMASSVAVDGAHLTHTPPDTQDRIDADAAKVACNYFLHDGNYCDECPVYDNNGLRCNEAMILDLLRRQRELDARKGGE